MNLTLEQNARDSLRRAIQYYNENSSSGLKAAVKESLSSIELFLKEKIRRLDLTPGDPVLIYDQLIIEIDNQKNHYLIKPKTKKTTITLNQAFERLEWLKEPISEPDKALINSLKNIRNSLEHLDINRPIAEIKRVFITVIGFYIKFLPRYLNVSFLSIVNNVEWQEILSNDRDLREIAKASTKEIFNSIIELELNVTGTISCFHCGSDCIEPIEGYYTDIKCSVCGYSQSFEMCYNCKKDFPIGDLISCEGDTMLCPECHQDIYGYLPEKNVDNT